MLDLNMCKQVLSRVYSKWWVGMFYRAISVGLRMALFPKQNTRNDQTAMLQ